MAVRHGTRTRYNSGCRCVDCKKAASDYKKAHAQKQRAARHGQATVTAIRKPAAAATPPPVELGAVEAGVMAEIDGLSTAASRQGLVQIAVALARVLDSPLAIAQHPSAAHRLSETLDKIRKGSDGKGSKLAAVRSMTRPGAATG